MFSMSFVGRGRKSFQKRLEDKAHFLNKDFELHDVVVAPHPGRWQEAVAAVRMTWEDASGARSVFEKFERPFVFEQLPTPPIGKLGMMIEALDARGALLPGVAALREVLVQDAEADADDGAEQGSTDPVASNPKPIDPAVGDGPGSSAQDVDGPQAGASDGDGGGDGADMDSASGAAGSAAASSGPASGASQDASPDASPDASQDSLPDPSSDTPPAAAAAPAIVALAAPVGFSLRIQAEDDDASDGASASITGDTGIAVVDDPTNPDAADAEGNAYVDYGNGVAGGESLTFTFDVPEAGEYDLVLRYAMGAGNRPLRLDVNGELFDRMFDLTSTGDDFTNFELTQPVRLTLEQGTNTITLTSNGASGPNIDYLEITAPDPDRYVIQGEDMQLSPAEDAQDSGTNRVATLDTIAGFTNGNETFRVGAEGEAYLDWASGNANATAEVTLDIATAGTYAISITYATSGARPLDLMLVDGGSTTTLATFDFAPTLEPVYYPDDTEADIAVANRPSTSGGNLQSEWEGWTVETVEVELAAGSNTLRLGGYTNGPNIDKMELVLVSAAVTGPDIAPQVVQAEDAELGAGNDAGTLVRDPANPEDGTGFQGLRPDYSGTGYVDFGSVPGDSLTFTVNVAEAGQYDLNFRYASNGDRPMDMAVNGGIASALAFVTTDPNATNEAPEGFDVWSYQTQTVALQAGDNTITLAIPSGAGSGPNIDRLELTTAGSGPVGDVEGDEGDDLAFTTPDSVVNAASVDAVPFTVAGLDDDIVYVGLSFDDGVNVEEVTPDASGAFSLDLSGQADGPLSATLIVMDPYGNRGTRELALTLDTTADEGGDLALSGPADPVAQADSAAVTFTLAGLDADADSVEVSLDGGATRTPVGVDGDSLQLDLSGLGGGSHPIVLYVTDLAGNEATTSTQVTLEDDSDAPLTLDFAAGPITSYGGNQDNPSQGTGAASEDAGATLALTDNVWKRVALGENYQITADTQLTLELDASSSPVSEIIAVGIDPDDNPFGGGGSLFQLGGTQTQQGFIDLRGQGTDDDGDGVLTFTIDLSSLAGSTIDSLVFVNDDDLGAKGSARFSNVTLSEATTVDTNQAPVVVGGGVADLVLDEGATLEVDLPFEDADGDDLSYRFEVADSDGAPVDAAGLAIDGSVLGGSLNDLVPGVYTVTLFADDGEFETSDSFVLTIENVNDAPVAEPAALEPFFGEVGESFVQITLADYAVLFSDPDGDDLTLSVEDLPPGLELVNGVIQGTPTEGGAFSVTLRASDPGGLSAIQVLDFQIAGTDIGDVVTIEAEAFSDLDAANLIVTANTSASNDQLIRLTSTAPAAIGTDLAAAGVEPGWYRVTLYVFDETDGEGELTLSIDGTALEARNLSSDSLTSDVVLSDDFGTLVGSGARGNAGQSGNRKAIVFETAVEITADSQLGLELRGQGGELMRIDSVAFERIEEPVNNAPTITGLGASVSVDENSSAVATLTLDDLDGDTLSVTLEGVDAPLFSFDAATGVLSFANPPDAELAVDADEDGVYEVTVVVSDGEDSVSQATLITVNDLNESLSIAQTALDVDENLTEIGAIAVLDEDGQPAALSAPVFAITGGIDAPLFTIDPDTGVLSFTSARDFELAVDANEDNVYEVEVSVTDDGLTTSELVSVSVNDVDEAPFSPLSLQAEDGAVESFDVDANDADTQIRDPSNPEPNQPTGLRPGFSGSGYLDFGDTPGDNISWQVDVAQAGQYDINVRYATNTDRPLDLVINGGDPLVLAMASTDPDGTGPEEGFDHWAFETITVTLEAGSNTIALAIPAGANTGPNIDRIEVTEGGSGPIVIDDSADEDGDLALVAADDSLDDSQLATAVFNVSGVDDDVTTVEVSYDGGATRTEVTPDASGNITLDLSGLLDDQSGDLTVTLIVTDATGNEASVDEVVSYDDGAVVVAPITLQAEDADIVDVGGTAQGEVTRVVDSANPDDFGNYRPGAVGEAYLDFGTNPGDQITFNVNAVEAGSYTATIRFANGGDAPRPLDLTVNGSGQGQLGFPNATGVTEPWEEWQTLEVTVELVEGANTFTLTIPAGAVNGPNIDQVVFDFNDGVTQPPFSFSIEGEALDIVDVDGDTQVRDPSNPETNAAAGADGLWDGFSGAGYLDMGGDVGDAAEFQVSVDLAGTYTLEVRYANGAGNGADRPMTVLVDGASQGSLAFASTGGDPVGWENWTTTTIEVELAAGDNTIRLANEGTAGPNIDLVTVSRDGVAPPRPVEPGDRFSVKINFQPEGTAVPDGYIADNGKAFGTQSVTVDGQVHQYGWVTEESIYDSDPGTEPLDISSLTSVAVNDRTDDIAGLDPRQGTYAHFDQPGNYVRAGWEIELDDGYYEVTISIGDTSGPYDSNNVLNAEGQLFNDPFTPFRPDDFPADGNPADDTEGVRSDLVTRIVQVTDGRLTLDSMGLDNENTEIQYIEIQALPDLTPGDGREAVEDYAFFTDARAIAGVGQNEVEVDLDPDDGSIPTGVDPTSDIFVGISVVDGRGGALLESLADGSIRLFETVTGQEVTFNANTTGGFDSLTISPSQSLKPFTSYTLVIDGFQDRGPNDDASAPTREFQKYTNTFVTGPEPEIVARDVAFNDVVELNGAADGAFGFTSLEMSPDGAFMYIATISGQLLRYDVDPIDGSLSNRLELSLPNDYFDQPGETQQRGIIGLVVDPTDPNVLWITDNYPIPLSGRDNGVPDFSGRITKITLDDGPGFSGTAEAYITGLPRSNGDHVTNSLEFRVNPDYDADTNPDVPSHLLYLIQGSNSAMGEPDSAWGNRPERLLNAAVMEIDPTRDVSNGPFDVTTEPLPDNGLNQRFDDPDGHPKDDPIPMGNGEFLVFDDRGVATVQDADGNVLESYYDPYAPDAVLTIFATGARNAYDLVWHSNGYLYVPTNGSAAGGNVPDDPNTPEDERYTNVEKQDDYLFRIEEGGYYGHPNPLRDEYILNGGNPTGGNDPNQVDKYPTGTNPEGTYDIAGVYSLGENRSPNGAVEYTSGVFGGNLQGNVLFTEYSGGDDVRSITLDANGNVIGDDVLRDPDGNVITYVDPLDIIENPATGQLYLLTLNRGNGQSQIIRLDPVPGGTTDPGDPDPDDDLITVLTIQAEDVTPNDGTSVTIATGADAEIEIRDINNPETNQNLPNGLRPGAFGLDGNTVDDDGVPGGYADFGSTNVDFITFSFELDPAQAGESVLRVRYGNGSDIDRPLEVFVNNVSVGVVSFPPSQDSSITDPDARWSDWLTVDITADLAAGLNTVRFQATQDTGPNIDQLEILREEDTTPGFTVYEAEDAVLGGAVFVPESQDDRNASGDGFVDFDGSGDQTITWTVDVAEDGSYEIGFRYALAASKADRPLGLTINGTDLGQLNFVGQSNDAEDDWFFQEVLVNLQAGSNTITLTAPGAVGPNIDLLRVPDSGGDVFIPVYADVSDGARIELEDGASARTVNELTADFYFTVDSDGLYRLDLAANAGGDNGGSLALTLNGQAVDSLAYPGVGDAGEEGVYVELEAGVEYNLRAVSAVDGADDLDYLDVTPLAGNANADIEVQSGDAAFYANRLHFSYLENNGASNPDREFKDSATVTISNSGSEPLDILEAEIDGPFVLADPGAFDGLTLAPGQSLTVTVLFDRDAYTPPANDAGDGVFEGRIRLVTNDADSPVAEIAMAGFWQARDEGGWEPNVNEIWEVFGFGNRIAGLTTVGGGENSVLNDFDLYRPVNDDEVLSRYWSLADGVDQAKITQLAAFHGNGGATLGIHAPGNKGQDIIFSNHQGDNNQTLLPLVNNGNFATATFGRGTIPDGWAGDEVFGIEVAGLSTDPSLNPSGGGTPPADADGIERGYTVRMFRALDEDGNVIPNTYLGIMDYTGINYDYNDNVFVIEGVKPVSGGSLTVTNNDGVPSNDRLVMSRIENPVNAAQEVHDEVTITLSNDGFDALTINAVAVSDPSLFELTQAFSAVVLEPGESVEVTVRFIADDPNDGSLYEASLIISSSDADEAEKVIELAGISQNQSESGQEPTVQEIVNAFGYTTDVAEGQMNQGGLVEANGDEILAPFFQRADGASPITITQLAAYHGQGDIARLFIHDVDSRDISEIIAHDEADGQTLLPRTLNNGDNLAVATLDRDDPFGFYAEISDRPGYISWSDPDANLYEDTIDAIGIPGANLNWDENDGHLIRVYVAKDADGNVIADTYIVIQDYAGVNYDYNDNIFLVQNVTPYDPTGVEDADGNGRVDLYDDDDGDGTPNFLDDPTPVAQTAFNDTQTAWAVGADGLDLEARFYDNGGQGVAYNDSDSAHSGNAFRSDEAVDISTPSLAIGFVADGEWVEYTLNVETAGTYVLNFSTSAVAGGKTITAAFEQDGAFYTGNQSVALPNTGSFTTFTDVGPLSFDLEEGEQVLRLTFNGGQLDLASFSLDLVEPVDDGQSAFTDDGTPWQVGTDFSLEAVNYDEGGQGVAYNDSSQAQLGTNPRGDGVDLAGGGSVIGWIENGEWVEYTLNVEQAGTYDLAFLASLGTTAGGQRSITASFTKGDGTPYATAGAVEVDPTGSWTNFVETSSTQVTLEAGEQVLRLTFNGGSMDLQGFSLSKDGQQAFNAGGNAWLVDADDGLSLDAVLFDEGEQGEAYNELSPQQFGSNFRDTPVDIVGQGDAVGWIDNGEWLEYTINVEQAGSHTLSFVTSGPNGGRSITASLEKDGSVYEQGSVATPVTSDWGVFVDSAAMTLDLEAGVQVLRLTFNGGSQDLASFQLTRDPDVAAASLATSSLLLAADDPVVDASSDDVDDLPMSDDVGVQGVQDDAGL
ncbi:carbohydrate-binding protein [Halomonas cupida]|uniref:carbohydrate-binding protein n=1 Tax=Halomonas cupida TaxID=44933 RepID=UPI003EF0F34A